MVNSAISGVEPISRKLSCAIVLFGIGYGLYVVAFYQLAAPRLRERGGVVHRFRWLIVILVAALNTVTWFAYARDSVDGHQFLMLGSFVFNVIIYSALVSLSIWYFWANRLSLLALPVFIGGLLIPVSDLYIFSTWLPSGQDFDVPAFDLYALNWILYFGRQVLFSFLPACADNDPSVERV